MCVKLNQYFYTKKNEVKYFLVHQDLKRGEHNKVVRVLRKRRDIIAIMVITVVRVVNITFFTESAQVDILVHQNLFDERKFFNLCIYNKAKV